MARSPEQLESASLSARPRQELNPMSFISMKVTRADQKMTQMAAQELFPQLVRRARVHEALHTEGRTASVARDVRGLRQC